MTPNQAKPLSVFVCGDVMTGRGIDQALPHPVDPVLYEPYLRDARAYVALAERASGPLPRPVDPGYVWGDVLTELERAAPDVRIVNLETSITTSEDAWPGKRIHYRMHPRNVGCLVAAGLDCCCLANNHVLDWGYTGLAETLQSLDEVGISHAGAGETAPAAAAPAVLEVPGQGRVLVVALGATTSGIPEEWAATRDRPGVNLLADLSDETARRVAREVGAAKRPGDVAVASIHWGENWGYAIPAEQITFAHRLVEAGVDVVHGHSSHHAKAIEVYRGRPILYGCGDFVDDYEGIGGHEEFRNDLRLMHLLQVDPRSGRLMGARLVPLQARRFRLNHAADADARWVADLLSRLGGPFGMRAEKDADNSLILRWQIGDVAAR